MVAALLQGFLNYSDCHKDFDLDATYNIMQNICSHNDITNMRNLFVNVRFQYKTNWYFWSANKTLIYYLAILTGHLSPLNNIGLGTP